MRLDIEDVRLQPDSSSRASIRSAAASTLTMVWTMLREMARGVASPLLSSTSSSSSSWVEHEADFRIRDRRDVQKREVAHESACVRVTRRSASRVPGLCERNEGATQEGGESEAAFRDQGSGPQIRRGQTRASSSSLDGSSIIRSSRCSSARSSLLMLMSMYAHSRSSSCFAVC